MKHRDKATDREKEWVRYIALNKFTDGSKENWLERNIKDRQKDTNTNGISLLQKKSVNFYTYIIFDVFSFALN